MEFEYMTIFKNQNRFCPICGKSFIMEEYQDNSEIQSRILKGELGHYKASNKKLQFEIEKEKYFNGLTEKDNRYFKERIRELIAQNEELKTKRQKMDQDLLERDEEILRLKNHNQNLLVKIRKSKDKKQGNKNSEQENQGLKEKLTEKEEEISCLRNLNQKLLEQIKILKDERKENLESEKDDRSENKEELLRLRRHNQDLLTQIKKLKHDKKSLQEELDRKTSLVDKETMTDPIEKLSDIQISTVEKGTNTKSVDVQIQKNAYIDKSLQTSKEDDSKEKSQEIRMPYRHPNHKSHYDQRLGEEENKQCSSYQQINYHTEKEQRQNQQLVGKLKMRIPIRTIDHQTIPMKVDLGWITPQKMQHISLGIRRLYHLVSSRVTTTSTKDLRRHRVPEQKLKGKPSSDYALRTKHF
jgi:ribosomal protein S27AE